MTMWEVDKKGDNSIFFETSFGIAWRAEKEKFIHLSEREIPAQPPKEIGKDQI